MNAGYDIVVADNYYNASPVVLDRVKQITGKDFRFYKADIDVYKRQAQPYAVWEKVSKFCPAAEGRMAGRMPVLGRQSCAFRRF